MKTKKLLIVCLALVLVAALISAVACNSHTHEYNKWERDATHHWKVCEEDGEVEEGSRAAHSYGADGKCVCGATKPASTDPKHECKDVCEECGKCTTECTGPVCSEKCPGHEPEIECDHKDIAFVEAVAPSCEAAGVVAHWYCEECGKYFEADEQGEEGEVGEEITEADTVAAALPHTWESEELIQEQAPTCGQPGTKAHRYCTVCEEYYDAEGELIGEEESDLEIPATGEHTYNTEAVNEQSWKWPDAWADTILTAGIKVEIECSVCNETYQLDATVTKVTEKCEEPDFNKTGKYVLTASYEGLTSGEKEYTIPAKPDGKPAMDFVVAGSGFTGAAWGDGSVAMKWDPYNQVFSVEIEFHQNDQFKVKQKGTDAWHNTFNVGVVTYADTVTQKPTGAPYTSTGANDYNFKMLYNCTATIIFHHTTNKIDIHVTKIDLNVKEAECYLRGGISNWSDQEAYKFTKQANGTFVLNNVQLTSSVTNGLQFKLGYDGEWKGYNDMTLDIQAGTSGVTFSSSGDGNITASKNCKVNLTLDPTGARLKLTIEVVVE